MDSPNGWAVSRAHEAAAATASGLQVDAMDMPYHVFRAYLTLRQERDEFEEEKREEARQEAERNARR